MAASVKSGKKHANKIQIRQDTRVGNIAAEADDEFLLECFVDNAALGQALDVNSNGMILSGRTGSGKTAILKYIESKRKNTSSIDPSDLSIQYISNSDVFQFLNDIGADLDLFFQVIWKHVLCISYIKLRYGIDDQKKYNRFFDRVTSPFNHDKAKGRAIEYLVEWGSEFWISIDENVRAITKKYEEAINGELGIDINTFKSKAGFGRNLSREQKSEYVRRARKIIDGQQLSDLSKVLDLLSGQEASVSDVSYYILIDSLDERWADDTIKFRLIRALIETLKSFRKIRNLKIIAALRADVIERSIQESKDSSFQREKYQDFIIEIKWSESELKTLINKRIRKLFQWKYTKDNVTFEDIFVAKIPPNRECFQYLLDRTNMRPRDIMAFVNTCLAVAEGSTEVTAKHVTTAEVRYSEDRYAALLDEWRTAFPSLKPVFDFFANGAPIRSYEEIAVKEVIEHLALPVCASGDFANDPVWQVSKEVMDAKIPSSLALSKLAREVFALLYRVGGAGIKRAPTEKYIYSYRDSPTIPPTAIPVESKIRFHYMLHRALGISEGRPPDREV